MNFPNTLASETEPIPKDLLSESDRLLIEDLKSRGYEVRTGLAADYIDAITAMANEPSIRTYCPKDCSERFVDQTTTERWLAKARGVFLLLKQTTNGWQLAGYAWMGAAKSDQVPGAETTFALRIGEEHQGQGLAAPFARLVVASSAILHGAKKIWLETWQSNGGAVHIYQKIGFKKVTEKPSKRLTPDGEVVADTRLYMSLPDELL